MCYLYHIVICCILYLCAAYYYYFAALTQTTRSPHSSDESGGRHQLLSPAALQEPMVALPICHLLLLVPPSHPYPLPSCMVCPPYPSCSKPTSNILPASASKSNFSSKNRYCDWWSSWLNSIVNGTASNPESCYRFFLCPAFVLTNLYSVENPISLPLSQTAPQNLISSK